MVARVFESSSSPTLAVVVPAPGAAGGAGGGASGATDAVPVAGSFIF